MRILVIGSGGREDALCWKLSSEPDVDAVYCAPGNPGSARYAQNVSPGNMSPQALADWAEAFHIDLTVIGPEMFLAAGTADEFRRRGLAVFGPSRAAAALETSKSFAKEVMRRAGVPTAAYGVFEDFKAAQDYIRRMSPPIVLKADGLAGGKGVRILQTHSEALEACEEMLIGDRFGQAGCRVVIEEFLSGREFSVFAVCDGMNSTLLIPARDHKRVGDGDTGPNTGGMGAYAPVPDAPAGLSDEIQSRIIQPTLDAMAESGRPFIGLLYAGLMLTDRGPFVIEFNARFGDPETQALLPLISEGFAGVLAAAARQELGCAHLQWKPGAAVSVVLASAGYPGDYPTGQPITGVAQAEKTGCVVFHAGTRIGRDGALVTSGGRVLNVVGLGDGLPDAARKAYLGAEQVQYEGKSLRHDIGRHGISI